MTTGDIDVVEVQDIRNSPDMKNIPGILYRVFYILKNLQELYGIASTVIMV